jgi:putative restriction endonuclease
MIGDVDGAIRRAVFDWLTRQRDEQGEALSRSSLVDFTLDGKPMPLIGAQGIWKPKACELPISITTVDGSQYNDAWDEDRARLKYSYRLPNPDHGDNRGLRRAMAERIPLVYFVRLEPGVYAAQYPVFIVGDDPGRLTFDVQVDDIGATLEIAASGQLAASDNVEARRAYVTRTVRQRLHQVAFRTRVLRAYQQRCALCSLRHQELLDAAHITPDNHPEGEPIVSNGVALCKLHHAAFDRLFFAIRPDYIIEVRPSILLEHDGPMLVVGLQQIHEKRILLPRRSSEFPDPERLARRYSEFLAAG